MISVQEALQIILNTVQDFGTELIDLSVSKGRVLREDIRTDRPLPPYDRVSMDGIAIQYDQYMKGQRLFEIEAISAAGDVQKELLDFQKCMEVMTGAVLPKGTDTVIRYEDTNSDGRAITISEIHLVKGQNIHPKGDDMSDGMLVVKEGRVIGSPEISAAASIGKSELVVSKIPKVLIVSTGDEVVPVESTPEMHQIRSSNAETIQSVLATFKIEADRKHMIDDKEELLKAFSKFLKMYDCIICCGGVSKGKFDFLPDVFNELGVKELFHKIAQRPGKPMWFGRYDSKVNVFGLPGNPVSVYMCCLKYISHWINQCMLAESKQEQFASLAEDVNFKAALDYYLPVSLDEAKDGRRIATPRKGNGSGDFLNLVTADAFMELPAHISNFKAGETFPLLSFL